MAVGERPVVRGRHMKSLVAALEGWEGGARPLAMLPGGVLQEVARAGGLDWLPLALNLQVTQAVYDGLGSAEADRFFRGHSRASLDGPILQTLVSTAVRMFGLDPVSFARWVPRAWHMLFRGVGEWAVPELEPKATSAVLTLAHLPADAIDHPVWVRSVARSVESLFDLAQVKGVVEVPPRAHGATKVEFRLRWTRRG